jgi:hypothetical protein
LSRLARSAVKGFPKCFYTEDNVFEMSKLQQSVFTVLHYNSRVVKTINKGVELVDELNRPIVTAAQRPCSVPIAL